jgi:hypothetical protein
LVVAGIAAAVWWFRTREQVTDAVTTPNNPNPGMPDMETQPAMNVPGLMSANLSGIGQIGATITKGEPVNPRGYVRPLIPTEEP